MKLQNLRINLLKQTNPIRRVWRYQRGNQNLQIKEGKTTQWPKEKVQKDKRRSSKHTYKIKDQVTRTPLKSEGELGCPAQTTPTKTETC
jgi:hypothetical protein